MTPGRSSTVGPFGRQHRFGPRRTRHRGGRRRGATGIVVAVPSSSPRTNTPIGMKSKAGCGRSTRESACDAPPLRPSCREAALLEQFAICLPATSFVDRASRLRSSPTSNTAIVSTQQLVDTIPLHGSAGRRSSRHAYRSTRFGSRDRNCKLLG